MGFKFVESDESALCSVDYKEILPVPFTDFASRETLKCEISSFLEILIEKIRAK